MKKAAPHDFLIDNFSMGLDWTNPESRVGVGWLTDALNVNLTIGRGVAKRGGTYKLYAAAHSANPIRNLFAYNAPNGNQYLLAACSDEIAYYDSGWQAVQTGLSSTARYYFAVMNGYCFLTNGVNVNHKIYNTTAYGNVGFTPPVTQPTAAENGAGVLDGKYYYKYAYARSGDGFVSNPSPASPVYNPSSKQHLVTVYESSDADVTNIYLYRTLDLNDEDNSDSYYYYVGSRANSDGTIADNKTDNELTTLLETDNTKPPAAKFCLVHRDRMIYANCAAETNGGSLFMISKIGKPEAVPSSYYHYFDRDDGHDITGVASLPEYLVVFKQNKTAVMAGDFEEWEILSSNIGCIAPYCIVNMGNKIVFLSEEGWKATDGIAIYDVGKKLSDLASDWNTVDAINFTGCYYPHLRQMLLNIKLAADHYVLAGHWLAELYMDVPVETAMAENYVGWTYHEWGNNITPTALGTYEDSSGIIRVAMGSSIGNVYELDNGDKDDGSEFDFRISTGWLTFDTPLAFTKTIRNITLVYSGAVVDEAYKATLYHDVDYALNTYGIDFAGITVPNIKIENCNVHETACGRQFRMVVEGTLGTGFSLHAIGVSYRLEGIR